MILENFKNGYDVTIGSSLAQNEKNDCAVRALANAFNISPTQLALAFVKHVVIDADAITCFEKNPKELFVDTYPHTILTPHEGEFRKMFNKTGTHR